MVRTNNNSGRRRSVRNSRSSGAMSRGRFLRTAGVTAAGVGAAVLGMSGVSSSALPINPPCGPKVWTLWAGQDIDAGTVTVWNDKDNLYVKYDVTGDWCINETHLFVGLTLDGMPTARMGQPIPGQFPYKSYHDPCVKTYTYVIPLSGIEGSACDKMLYIVPHAAIERVIEDCKQEAVVYGIQRYTGMVYSVDVLNGVAQPAFQIPNPPAPGSATPNGLAYSSSNGFVYYTDYVHGTNDKLYFWDGTQQQVAGTLVGAIACGDIDDSTGKYYYIPHNTDDLYEVTLGPDGKIALDPNGLPLNTKIADLGTDPAGNTAHKWSFNGDIAVKDGVVYGWGRCAVHGKYEFFTYNIATNAFTLHVPAYQASLQLAFGSNGDLYGHRSGGSGEWFVVDTANGAVTQPAISAPGKLFTDAASGGQCVPEIQDETAFGGDTPGSGPRWWYYLGYTICCEQACQEETAWGGNSAGGGDAWWYYFDTTYHATQTIWAGQYMAAGNVSIAPNPDGTSTISIVLNDGWQLQNVPQPVKIQGYNDDTLPNTRPAAGLFTTYKGTARVVNVPSFAQYAIHLDVQLCQ